MMTYLKIQDNHRIINVDIQSVNGKNKNYCRTISEFFKRSNKNYQSWSLLNRQRLIKALLHKNIFQHFDHLLETCFKILGLEPLNYNMEISKESFDKVQKRKEDTSEEQLFGIAASQDEGHHVQYPTSLIQNFIETKYGEVMNLQGYLISELQYIQNCKERNKNIEKCIVSKIIPSLNEFKKSIQGLRSVVKLIQGLAANYVEAVGQKSKNILMEKQDRCVKYESQIKSLRKQVESLKRHISQLQNNKLSAQKYNFPQLIKSDSIQFLRQRINQQSFNQNSHFKNEQKSNERRLSNNRQESQVCLNKSLTKKDNDQISLKIREQEGPMIGRTSLNNLKKYEQCYKNILSNKKANISYKCQKSPIKSNIEDLKYSKSPRKIEVERKVVKREITNTNELQDRKQYIKQKIQKIKIKAQCREFQKNPNQKQRMR